MPGLRPSPGNTRLSVDHDHAIANWPIECKKIHNQLWWATPANISNPNSALSFSCDARTKPLARAAVKAILLRISTRGILCWGCNAGLQKFQDDPIRLHKAAEYLDEYYEFLNGTKDSRNGFK